MATEPSDIEKMLEQLMAEQDHQESITQGVRFDIQTEEFQHYSLIEQTLLSNGINLSEEGLADYFFYSDNLVENMHHDVITRRVASILNSLGFLAYDPIPLTQITQIDEEIVEEFESVFMYEVDNDLAWLKTLRDILPNATFLKSDNDTELISNFRDRSTMRAEIGAFESRLRRNARTILTSFVIEKNGEHDDNSTQVTKLVAGVIGIFELEDPPVTDMRINTAMRTLESFGYSPEEALALLKTVHDQSIDLP